MKRNILFIVVAFAIVINFLPVADAQQGAIEVDLSDIVGAIEGDSGNQETGSLPGDDASVEGVLMTDTDVVQFRAKGITGVKRMLDSADKMLDDREKKNENDHEENMHKMDVGLVQNIFDRIGGNAAGVLAGLGFTPPSAGPTGDVTMSFNGPAANKGLATSQQETDTDIKIDIQQAVEDELTRRGVNSAVPAVWYKNSQFYFISGCLLLSFIAIVKRKSIMRAMRK